MKYLKTFESSNEKMYVAISSDEYYEKTGGNIDDREEGLSFVKNNFEKIPEQEINRIQNVVKKVELYHGLLSSGVPEAEYNLPTFGLMIQMRSIIQIFFKRNEETPFHTTIMVVYKLKDEYFYVYDTISGDYFKCDTVKGLLRFIKDNSNIITDYLEDTI